MTWLRHFKVHQTELLFIPILFLAISLRLYHLNSGFGYFGDQGRDLLQVYSLIVHASFPVLGPKASMGSFHLGPLFYYILAPWVLLAGFNPVGAVLYSVFSGVLLVVAAFLLLRNFADTFTAFITATLLSFSPLAVFLSRGSWNPNSQPLVVILLLYALLKFLKDGLRGYIFLVSLLLGIGVQLHYTFLTNFISVALVLLIFKRKALLDYKVWILGLLGFLLPLTLYLLGQLQSRFSDLQNLQLYFSQQSPYYPVLLQTLIDRFSFPFSIYYPADYLPYFLRTHSLFFYLIIALSFSVIAFSKTHLRLISQVIFLFFFTGTVVSGLLDLNFYEHYYEEFSVLSVFMVGILISYLYHYGKVKTVALVVFLLFSAWQISVLPQMYMISRSPQVVYESSQVIINDMHLRGEKTASLYVISPVTISPGFEYRYMIEKSGLKTLSAVSLNRAGYLIVESSTSTLPKIKQLSRYTPIKKIPITDQSTEIRYSEVFRSKPRLGTSG